MQNSVPHTSRNSCTDSPAKVAGPAIGAEATDGRPREALLSAWGLGKGFLQDWRLRWDLKDVQAEGAVWAKDLSCVR